MQKKKLPRDPNALAARIVALSTGQDVPSEMDAAKLLSSAAMRKQIMCEMGARGGKKGGKARAESLSVKRRKEIAKNAAISRWKKQKQG